MESTRGMFAIKMVELNQQYDQLRSRILSCEKYDHKKILQEIVEIRKECLENDLYLQSRIHSSRSPVVSDLAAAQMDYFKKTEEILQKTPHNDEDESEFESAALFAEYAIDFASQAIHHALLATLRAIELQNSEEKIQKEIKK